MSAKRHDDDVGCLGCLVGLFILGLIFAAVISLAAVIDPFAWMPPVGEIWADCEGECDLADRFPGFWGHVALNLLYTAAAGLALLSLMTTVREFRDARPNRYSTAEAMAAYRTKRDEVAGMAVVSGAFGLLPIIVAIR
jgi:hypothetical protein